LNGSRLARKYAETIASRVPGQVDQDLDLIGLYLPAELFVRELKDVPPAVRYAAEDFCERIGGIRGAVAGNFELALIVI